MKKYSYNSKFKSYARSLRRTQTDAEKLLWSKLRARQFMGYKFKRQYPILNYILDFYCDEERIAIELDGSQHMSDINTLKDKNRVKSLLEIGVRTLRYFDNDVLVNINGVLEDIQLHIKTSPQPSPTRRGTNIVINRKESLV